MENIFYIVIAFVIVIVIFVIIKEEIRARKRRIYKIANDNISLNQYQILSQKGLHSHPKTIKILDFLYHAPWLEEFDSINHSGVWIEMKTRNENRKYKLFSVTSRDQLGEGWPGGDDCKDKYVLESVHTNSEERDGEYCLSFEEMIHLIVKRKDEE